MTDLVDVDFFSDPDLAQNQRAHHLSRGAPDVADEQASRR